MPPVVGCNCIFPFTGSTWNCSLTNIIGVISFLKEKLRLILL